MEAVRITTKALELAAKADCWDCHDLEGIPYTNHIENHLCYQHEAKQALAELEGKIREKLKP